MGCRRRNSLNQDYPALCAEHPKIADNARSRAHEGTLSPRLRRDRQTAARYCRMSCAPFALLESRIRNVLWLSKNAKIIDL